MSDSLLELTWSGGQRFSAAVDDHEFSVDGEGAAGISPTQHLAVALAGCMGIDIAYVLEKMRTPPDSLTLSLQGERADEPPRRFLTFRLQVNIVGDVPRASVDRAVALSRERYCSVWHSLAQDTRLAIDVEISPRPPA